MKEINTGTRCSETFIPTVDHLASQVGNHGVDVVATTALILFFETTSNNLVVPYLEVDEVSVGTHVCVDHLAPATGEHPIVVNATLVLRQGRRLEFDLEAKQKNTLIMTGKHCRAVMLRQKFSSSKTAHFCKPKLEFWFDFHSPWCYFASHQIDDIAREFDAELIWKPVHLANLNLAIGGRRPLEENSNFVAWYQQDMLDTACLRGLPFSQHRNYPCRPSRALRASIYAAEQNLVAPFVKILMKGCWSIQISFSDHHCWPM